MRSADFTADAFLVCADRYWRLHFLAEPSARTAAACAAWLTSHVAAPAGQQRVRVLTAGM